jgi:predicted regulator of Ras-like GTPase activity (Roadblock/LC7/MglB family)
VGEGGRGDEGQKARECSKPRIAPDNSTLESPDRGAGAYQHLDDTNIAKSVTNRYEIVSFLHVISIIMAGTIIKLSGKDPPTMASRQEQITAIIDQLMTNTGTDVVGAAAVGLDGIALASRMSSEVSNERLAAVAATIMGVTRRVGNELRIGFTEEIIIKANKGLFMVLPAGDQSLLAISLRQDANLGLVRLEARDAARSIGQILTMVYSPN